MNKVTDIVNEVDRDSFVTKKTFGAQSRKKYYYLFITVPLLSILFFSYASFQHGSPGFRVDKTQRGLRISEVSNNTNPVQEGDLIVAINGIPYSRILGLLLLPADQTEVPSVTVLRGRQTFEFIPEFTSLTRLDYFTAVWPQILLITIILTSGSIALFRAPPGQPVTFFFFMTCSLSTVIAAIFPSDLGVLQPKIISLSFIGTTFGSWAFFGSFAHFSCKFPKERDLLAGKPLLASMLYLVPITVGCSSALITAGFTEDFFAAFHRFREICVPILLIGSFVKHVVDLRYLSSPSAKNQVKLTISGYWLTFTPFLLFFILPSMLFDQPMISFSTVMLAGTILPAAHFIAILRYNLFGVDRLISRVTAYFIVIFFLTVLYAILLAILKRWFFGRQLFSEEFFLLFLLLVALGVRPLINWVQKIVDRIFFRYRPSDNTVLFDFSQKLVSTLKFSELAALINYELPQLVQITRTALLLIDEKRSRVFPDHLRIGSTPWPDSCLVQQFRDGKQSFICLEEHDDAQLNLELSELCKAGFTLVLPLRRGDTLLAGVLLLGPRKDGGLFRDNDIRMFATLANQAAVALDNSLHYTSLAKSKEQLEALYAKVVQAKKMAALGEMTATLAHEIRNPLGIIRSSAQYLAEADRPVEINQEMLAYIIDEVDGLNTVVSSILGLAKFKKPILKTINLQKEIPKLCQQWQLSDGHNPAIQIHCSVVTRLPLLYADFQQLRQVLLNLIHNSEEALGDEGNITLSVEQDNDFVLLRLQDDGPGVAEEHANELFKNFFTTKEDGLGMGLTVCKQIIAAHHGSIIISNLPEGGVEVLIHLPLRPLATLGQEEIETEKS